MKKKVLKRKEKADFKGRKMLLEASKLSVKSLLQKYGNSNKGYSLEDVAEIRELFGDNQITEHKSDSIFKKIWNAFINPFTVVLIMLATISFVTDIVLPAPGEKEYIGVIIVVSMVMISGILRFVQEQRSNKSAEKLRAMVKTTTAVKRKKDGIVEVPLKDVVVGDIVVLAVGDMIPADLRIISSKDLFISQSSLTGESEPIEKFSTPIGGEIKQPLEALNLAFMGSNVVSGSAMGIVIAVGDNTYFGSMAGAITVKKVITGFDKGITSVSWLLIRFMMCMVPIVFFINGFTKGDWLEAFLFALSIAVGLTPEMLPMIVTTTLAKGSVKMAKKKTVVKNISAVQNFGAMNVLCTDKTGTITQDKVVLEYHLNIQGEEDERVLRHGYLNSYHQTGLKNLMDIAILKSGNENGLEEVAQAWRKVDEIPFDFTRRRMSVVVADTNGKTQLITKGAVEEMLVVSDFVEYKGVVEKLTEELKEKILKTVDDLNQDGMRVIAVAQKTNPSTVGEFSVKDESAMVLMGYLAFLDPPKKSTKKAIKALEDYGVNVKVLTGDNDGVTRSICRQVGLKVDNLLLGSDMEIMSDEVLSKAVYETSVFAKLSPQQKVKVVAMLRENGHTVGFMGDGINDAAAMREADVGVSVDTAVDIAKESADIILLEKNLMVLEEGVVEGRKTFGNIIKYIKMTASSNFGNMFSVLVASVFLPFLPMLPIQILMLNLIYDISCISMPWDNIDKEYLKKPRKCDASSIGKFMLHIGPSSSVFDIATYVIMFFVICPAVLGGPYGAPGVDKMLFMALFNTGWFVESLWSQTFVIHMIRTPKIPFIESRASLPVIGMTTLGVFVGTVLPFTVIGSSFGMVPLPLFYFPWLLGIIACYMVLVTLLKKRFIRKNGECL